MTFETTIKLIKNRNIAELQNNAIKPFGAIPYLVAEDDIESLKFLIKYDSSSFAIAVNSAIECKKTLQPSATELNDLSQKVTSRFVR